MTGHLLCLVSGTSDHVFFFFFFILSDYLDFPVLKERWAKAAGEQRHCLG